jgi:hypothetical protein
MLRNTLFPYLSIVCMAAAGGEGGSGGGGGAPEVLEVDLFDGVKVKLPKDEAAKVITARDARKAEMRGLNERLAAIEGEKRAAETKAAEEKAEAERKALTSQGQFDKALQAEQKKFAEKEAKVATKFRDAELRRQINGHPKLAAVSDATTRKELADLFFSQLVSSCQYDLGADILRVSGDGGAAPVDADGKPITADAWITNRLDASPLLKPAASPGSGAAGGAKGSQGNHPTITRAQYDAAVKGQDDATMEVVRSGKYRLVD